jgi:pSer/pThr/pTyr-binding forkhead associated (FHA) protein
MPGTYPQVKGQAVTAWLVPLNDRFETLRAKAIPLTRQELVIGKDSQQSGLVIPSPAMSDVHARLTRDNLGDFWLADNNSIAGTWVNYAPLSSQGLRLRHGDLVHFANNAYRFELTAPPPDREPQLITYNNVI